MIQLVKRPHETAFSRNPIAYQIRAVDTLGAAYRAVGARAVFDTYAEYLNPDDTLTFSWTDATGATGSILFTAKATPLLDTDLPANQPLSIVAQYIAAHRLIAPVFNVYYRNLAYQTIVAEVRAIETGWTMDWDWLVNDDAQKSLVPFSEMNAPSGYYIGYEVFFEVGYNSRKWQSIHTGRIYPRADGGDLYLNIADILDTQCRATLLENPFSAYSKVLPSITDNERRYYVRFREYGDVLATQWQTEAISTVLMGGLPNQVWLTYPNWFAFQVSDIGRTWLTYRQNQVVYFGKPSWISWFNPYAETISIQLMCEWTDQNGNQGSGLVADVHVSAEKDRCVTFAVSPDALGLNEDVRVYSIQVLTTFGQALSVKQYFRVDTLPYRNTKVLAYLNAFGCPETVICTGENTRQITMVSTQTESVRGVNYVGGITRSERFLQSFQINYIYRTGILSAAQREALTELQLSDVFFDITGSSYLALVLKAESSNKADTIFDSSEVNYGIEWTAVPRLNMGAWGSDRSLHQAEKLNEPVFSLITDTNTGGGIDFPIYSDDDTPDGFTEVGTLEEADLLVFAKLNAQGEIAGFYTYRNGKYKRLIRGIALDAPSHLDGLGIKTASGDTWIESKDDDGTPSYLKQ